MRLTVILIALFLSTLGTASTSRAGAGGSNAEARMRQAGEMESDPPLEWSSFPLSNKYFKFKDHLTREYGLAYAVFPTLILQGGTQGGRDDFTLNEQVHAMALWQPFRKSLPGGSLFAYYMHMRQPTSTRGTEFTESIGTSFQLSDSVIQDNILRALFWEQKFFDARLNFRVGYNQLAWFDSGLCQYSCYDTDTFISQPLSTNPARTLPGSSASIDVAFFPVPELELLFGIQGADGDNKLRHFDRPFKTGELAYIAQMTWKGDVPDIGHGEYRLSGFHVESIDRGDMDASTGIQFNFEQDLPISVGETGKVGLFVKGAATSGRKAAVKHFLSAGAVLKGVFLGPLEDWVGLGGGWTKSSTSGVSDDGVLEVFYRWQVTPTLQLSPDIQLVFPSRGSATEAVFSFRVNLNL